MEVPLEIAFHNVDASAAVEHDIRERVGKLERIYGPLVRCRVSVEALHKKHRTGNVYDVHIEMHAPNGKLVVSREPHRAAQRQAKPNIRTSVREAFDAAAAQLKRFKEQQAGETKLHPPMFQGEVAQLHPDKDFGFILTNDGTQLYFHRNSVMNGDLDRLKRGDAVHYIEAAGDTGPTAAKVWIGPDFHLD
jgi:cold shock CspA family protein/ribosome-associated translation inhibitor RaiA